MATKPYWFAFGSGTPVTTSGLNPTFTVFVNTSGATIAPPSIAETFVGTGLYLANYSATQTIAFILDGATTGLATSDRYIAGVMDPNDLFGFTLVSAHALGVTSVAGIAGLGLTLGGIGSTQLGIGTSLVAGQLTLTSVFTYLGSTASSFGATNVDPTTVFGFLKRSQEMAEGNQVYTKATGLLDFYNRGSSTLLREKTISDSTTSTTKN